MRQRKALKPAQPCNEPSFLTSRSPLLSVVDGKGGTVAAACCDLMSQTRPHRQSYGFADREPALLVDPKITPALVADDRLVRAPCPHAVIFRIRSDSSADRSRDARAFTNAFRAARRTRRSACDRAVRGDFLAVVIE